ncbi:hypothetical protein [Nocardia australiensis]|uniref:hypothetical protein n=1 Tax=Nocardia australiensis TaxID=2887191 RepID=UPI001D158DF9|nr:hypothetical protein [Nocardia australiensis]
MSDNLKHDAELFEKAAHKTGYVRDRVNSVLSTLEGSLHGRGKPWGEDKLGDQFFEGDQGYKVSREKLFTNIKNAAASFDNFSNGQTTSAELLRKMDHSNSDGFQ